MFFKRKKEIDVKSSFAGKVVSLENVKDSVFSEKVLGDGIAVSPEDGTLYAPVSGKVVTIFDTKHAIGFELKNNIIVLMHIGIDTVELGGKGFKLNIKTGDRVSEGQEIGKIDINYIKSKKKDTITPILITNHEKYKISYEKNNGDTVKAGETIFKIIL